MQVHLEKKIGRAAGLTRSKRPIEQTKLEKNKVAQMAAETYSRFQNPGIFWIPFEILVDLRQCDPIKTRAEERDGRNQCDFSVMKRST